jgi:hypothetical protein
VGLATVAQYEDLLLSKCLFEHLHHFFITANLQGHCQIQIVIISQFRFKNLVQFAGATGNWCPV